MKTRIGGVAPLAAQGSERPKPDSHGGLFGRIAIHLKLISQEQLLEAIKICGRYGNKKRIGEVLVELGWMNLQQVDQVLAFQKQHLDKPSAAGGPPPSTEELLTPPAATPLDGFEASLHETPAAADRKTRKMEELLLLAGRHGVSDLHLHVGHPLLMRIHGRLLSGKTPAYGPDTAQQDLLDILTPAQRERLQSNGELCFSYEIPGMLRVRAVLCRQQRGGVNGVFRLIPVEVPNLESLGLPREIARFTTYQQGLVLVTGPAGCGKSTTLAGLVDSLNIERKEHIITIEDPIEFVHSNKGCLVRQREIGIHTQSFVQGMKSALREDPDIIILGELRNRESISMALAAAESGHLVYGTLHCQSAVGAVHHLLGAFPQDLLTHARSQVSENLRGVFSQRLVPAADGKRRIAVAEMLTVTVEVSKLIREGRISQIPDLMSQTKNHAGMRCLDDALSRCVEQGVISKEAAKIHAEKPEHFA